MADTARLDAYANWLRTNQDKAGSPEFVKVADAYRNLRTAGPAQSAPWDATKSVSSGLSGANSSVASTFGAPVDLMNWGLKKVGMGSERPFMGSDQIEGWMRDAGMIKDYPGYEFANKVGQNVGSGVLTALTAGAAAPSLARGGYTTAAEVAKTFGPTGSLAGTVGREALAGTAQTLGGEGAKAAGAGPLGQMLAEIVAGTAPSALAAGGKEALRGVWSKPGPADAQGRSPSRQAFDDLEAAGITPRPGLVGNKGMSRVENTYAQFPLAGAIPAQRFDQGFREFQTSLYDRTDNIGARAMPGVEQPAGQDMLGGRMRIAANDGIDNMDAHFNRGYDNALNDLPADTLVDPRNARAAIRDANSPISGESQATRGALNDFAANEINPSVVHEQGPTVTGDPIDHSGIPIRVARKVGTEAFYDAQGGKMVGGATEQVRGGLKQDMARTLMDDPAMIREFPDPAARQARVEQLRVLDNEYAASRATDISPSGGTVIDDRFHTGGDQRALDQVANAQSDKSAFGLGSDPGRMAVLQRNNPGAFPDIAADTVRERAQSRQPFGDINISPQNFDAWWRSLSPNERMIYTNEGFDPRRSIPMQEVAAAPGGAPNAPVMESLDEMQRAGALFRQRGQEANPSGTAPTLATIGVGTGLITNPLGTLGTLLSAGVGGGAVSSKTLAEILAGIGPTTPEQILRGAARTSGRVALTPGN
jgi:hypothetical protein